MRLFFAYQRTVAAGLILLLFSLGCGQAPAAKDKVEVIPVKALKVRLQDLSQTIDYVGDIKAYDQAAIYPKVSGKIIEKVKEDGAAVVKGEAVAYIDRDEVGLKFEKAPVESTLSGTVGRVYVDIGENVSTQTPIALVVSMDRVKINLDIPEKYLPRVSLGQQAHVSVDAYPKEEFPGKVTKVSPVVDLNTRAAPVEIIIDNPGHRLKSGMFAKVSLVLEERRGVPVVLKEAILGKEPDLYVFVVEKDRAVLKRIIPGIRQGPYLEVKEGLKEGDLAVIMGQQRLKDNSQVSVEIEETSLN